MADPLTYQVLQGAQQCLQQILVANGFHSDAGLNVALEVEQVPGDEAAPVLGVVYSGGRRPESPQVRDRAREIRFRVIAKVPAGAAAQLSLHQVLEDVHLAMSKQPQRFPGLSRNPVYVEEKPIEPKDGTAWVGAYIEYATTVLAP